MSAPIDVLLPRLEHVTKRGDGKWMAACPAHSDRSPSLSVCETPDGTVLIHCFAGCPASEVIASVGLSMADLFVDGSKPQSKGGHRPRWTVQDIGAALDHEILLVMVVANDITKGRAVRTEDVDRVSQAYKRLQRIREICRA